MSRLLRGRAASSSPTGSPRSTRASTAPCRPARQTGWKRTAPGCRLLPPIAPPGWWEASLRLPRDHYVRLDTCDYSVHPLAVGRRIEVAADLD